jgi:hypothetical protein
MQLLANQITLEPAKILSRRLGAVPVGALYIGRGLLVGYNLV